MAAINTKIQNLKPIHSILIANRGEIASRIIRTCKRMGIKSIAIFSEIDANMPFVKEADMAVFIGENEAKYSYLQQEKILAICQKYQISAVHPGYGFLAENSVFAQKCQEAGITFIGPTSEAIAAMGSKAEAKKLMQQNGVPIIKGYQGEDQTLTTLKKEATSIGFPLLLKATAGGGGKGMRIVNQENELENAIQAAKNEAKSAFGNDELIIEKYINAGRHIEFQIFGDKFGNIVHIFERECTIQRRYQKIIEESPSPVLTEALRKKMGEAAIKAAQAIQYQNAGTVEFIFDAQTQEFYFLEVNTRLQVEHPVTEVITNLDLVQLQIEIAEGKPLPFTQEQLQTKGYALECRLYAEDTTQDFLPSTGKVHLWKTPKIEGLRIETAVETGSEISIFYDPMIAKLIVWDMDRLAAHRKMRYALQNLRCLGLKTNQDFLIKLLENQAITEGNYTTQFLKESFDFGQMIPSEKAVHFAFIAATLYDWQTRDSKRTLMRNLPSGWRNNFYQPQQERYLLGEEEFLVQYRSQGKVQFQFFIQEKNYAVTLRQVTPVMISLSIEEERLTYFLHKEGNTFYLHNEQFNSITFKRRERFPIQETEKLKGGYVAPMPSQVVKILVEVGQKVKEGDGLIVLSSMKMENMLTAEEDGFVKEIFAQAGQNVEAGIVLLQVEK